MDPLPFIRPATTADLDAAHACYRRNAYTGTIQPEDLPLVAVAGGEVVGVVRIALENGHQLLRGMFLDETQRRRGLGTRMLQRLAEALDDAPCWLICGPHLIGFYGQVGFRLTEDLEAPPHVQERVARYREVYGPQCLLRRAC